MEIIEQIGSYAGLAAIVGLAVLSALYFSQARDLRRLRESEDERAPVPDRVTPAPGPKRPTAARAPAAAQAAPAGATPEPHPAGAPTQVRPPPPAQEGGDEKEEEERAAPAAGAAAGAATAAAPATAREGPAAAPATPAGNDSQAQPAPASAGGNATAAPRAAPPRLPQPRPGATAAALRSTTAPSIGAPRKPWYRRVAPRYLVLIVGGVVVLGAGGAYAVTTLVGEGDETVDTGSVEGGGAQGGAAPLDPSTITVAVLNGTDLAGLAAQVADTVESAGFQRGNVANATDTTSAESAVLYADGARGAARQVGQELDIAQIEPIDEETQSLAGTADVAVIVGADQAE